MIVLEKSSAGVIMPICRHCGRECKLTELKTVRVRQGLKKDRTIIWSARKRICIRCQRKRSLAGYYKIVKSYVPAPAPAKKRPRKKKPRKKKSTKLNETQKRVLAFIVKSIERNSRSPTYEEIRRHLGKPSRNSGAFVVNCLVDKGFLVKDRRERRGIRLNPEKYTVTVVRK